MNQRTNDTLGDVALAADWFIQRAVRPTAGFGASAWLAGCTDRRV